MKSNDFTEAINWGNVASKIDSGIGKLLPSPQEKRDILHQNTFVDSFKRQVQQNFRLHPNTTIDDFLTQYFIKNNWNINNLAPAYTKSLDAAKEAASINPSDANIKHLGEVIYSVAIMLPSTSYKQQKKNNPIIQQQQQQGVTKSATLKVATDTNQILSKIRSMKNSPEEIDDLINIASVVLIKLKMIAPNVYKDVIIDLFNNGGNPSVSAAINTAQQSTPPESNPITEPITFGTSKAQKSTKLDPNDSSDAALMAAIQKAQAQGR